jgi:putative FmdB family regulatory protein
MPVYEYRCRTCDQRFEMLRPIGEATAGVTCPAGHAEVERLLSVVAPSPRTESGGGACCAAGCSCGAAGGYCS